MFSKKPSDMFEALRGVAKSKPGTPEVAPPAPAGPPPSQPATQEMKPATSVSQPPQKPAAGPSLNQNLITMSYETAVCGVVVLALLLAVSFIAGYQMGGRSAATTMAPPIATPPGAKGETIRSFAEQKKNQTPLPVPVATQPLSSLWSVPLASGTLRSQQEVRDDVRRLRRGNFPEAFAVSVKYDRGKRFIIYCGTYKTKEEAEHYKKSHQKQFKDLFKARDIPSVENIKGAKIE